MIATRGWQQTSAVSAVELAHRMVGVGVVRFVCTDVARDSTLTEPNFAALDMINRAVGAAVIASGGVTTAAQIAHLARLGLEGAIVGSALYAGKLTVEAALAAARLDQP
jgi:phosphoribosylformimino-5-aminoimidazole carboxamide ribotide isomerase